MNIEAKIDPKTGLVSASVLGLTAEVRVIREEASMGARYFIACCSEDDPLFARWVWPTDAAGVLKPVDYEPHVSEVREFLRECLAKATK